MKTITKFVYATLAALELASFALGPSAEAVLPAPDGGYPGGNTAEGQSALLSLGSGTFNTALGWSSLWSNTTGSYNTATGAGALFINSTGSNNTANGIAALLFNTTGSANTATGNFALASNTTASNNTANGASALVSNTVGGNNTAIGVQALGSNTGGSDNVAVGYQALLRDTTGGANIAVGPFALQNNTTGDGNIVLGYDAGYRITTAHNVICIGQIVGDNITDSCFINNIAGVTPVGDPIPVVIGSAGQLGTTSSSRRFKKEIKPMDKASEAILSLKPVTFHYRTGTKGTPQFGLIAEEVAEVNPDLVVRDKNGEIYTVRYDAVNAMLLNEFLKEHRKVQDLQATVAQQQHNFQSRLAEQEKQIEALASGLRQVSAQVERSEPTPQVVVTNP